MENRVFIFSSKIISFLLISSILFSQCLFWAADEIHGRSFGSFMVGTVNVSIMIFTSFLLFRAVAT